MNWTKYVMLVAGILLLVCGGIGLMEWNPTEQVVEDKWSESQPKRIAYYQEQGGVKVKIKEEKFYENGQVEYIGGFDAEGQRDGHWQYYYPNGNLWSEGDFDAGQREGVKRVYWDDGTLRYQGQYNDNLETGEWIFYARDGTQDQVVKYENGEKKVEPAL